MTVRRLLLSALLATAATTALAQAPQPPAAPGGTPLPRSGRVHQEMEPSLIVMNSRGATLSGTTLVLEGISPQSIVFADRPVRAAGHALTRHLLEEWNDGNDSFGRDPPNATVSVVSADGESVKDAVVVLKSPKLEGERLTFTVQVLEGSLADASGPASVFIDIIGMPWTPLSYAGVARRTARRAYWYGATHPYYPPPPYYRPPAYYPPYYPPPPPYYRPPYP